MKTKGNSIIEYKSLPIDVSQDVDYENRKVRGYLAKFNILDSDYDVTRKGAFAKSIQERGPKSTSNRQIKYLIQHDLKTPAGIFVDLYEDSIGLGYEGFIEKTPAGDATLERIRIGFYREHSYGFNYVQGKCDWVSIPFVGLQNPMNVPVTVENGAVNVFECKEMNLFEGSIVTFGASSETPFVEFKCEADKDSKISALKELYDYLIKQAPNYDYELILRSNYKKELTLLESLAVKSTKEDEKPAAKKRIDINFLTNNY